MKKGSKLILAPKLSSAWLMVICPIIHDIVGHPESLYFIGMGPDSISLIFVGRKSFLGMFVFLFFVHISFKNFAYDTACYMTSRSGTFICT